MKKLKVSIPTYILAIKAGKVEPKGWMRNNTCVCGNRKKFKHCCYDTLKRGFN